MSSFLLSPIWPRAVGEGGEGERAVGERVKKLLLVERNTPCTSIMLASEMDTPYTSIMLAVERDLPCTSILLSVEVNKPCTPYCWCCWWWKGYTLHIHRQVLMVLFLLYDIEKSYVNARMPEKFSPASAFLPVVSRLSPALAFRHQGLVWYRNAPIPDWDTRCRCQRHRPRWWSKLGTKTLIR